MIAHQANMPAAALEKSRDKRVMRRSYPMPRCPRVECRGRLHPYPTVQASYDSVTGLDHVRCDICGHQGMRVPNGLHLVFRGPDEYVFYYPPSLANLTIVVSPSLLTSFMWHSLTPIQIVIFTAEWVLLTGRANGTVRFTEEKVALEDCYNYFLRHMVREGGVRIT